MTKKEIEPIWNHYLAAYGNVSSEMREQLLRQSVTEDIVSINPGDECQGLPNLMKHIEQFQVRIPGAYFKVNKLLVHHNQLLSEWTLHKGDGSAVTTAHTHAVFNERGLVTNICGFF